VQSEKAETSTKVQCNHTADLLVLLAVAVLAWVKHFANSTIRSRFLYGCVAFAFT